MNSRNRIKQGLKAVAVWWLLSALVAGVIGSFKLGREMALLNIAATTVFSIFLLIGVIIGSKSDDVNNIDLSSPKIEPAKKKSDTAAPCCDHLMVYSAYLETRRRSGTMLVVAKNKEAAKRKIIETFPDCKIMFFEEWLRDGNYSIQDKLGG